MDQVQDITRLDVELTWLRDHENTHDQGNFGTRTNCGTVACLAGWAILHEPGWTPEWLDIYDGPQTSVQQLRGAYDPNEVWYGATEAGMLILGLEQTQADAMFYEARDLGELVILRDMVADGVNDYYTLINALPHQTGAQLFDGESDTRAT